MVVVGNSTIADPFFLLETTRAVTSPYFQKEKRKKMNYILIKEIIIKE